MEKTFFGDVGQRVETQSELGQSGVIPDGTRDAAGTIGGEFAKGGEALQSALRKSAVVIGNRMQDRRDEVIAYTRRQPVGALTAAAGVGVVVGLCLAMASRGAAGGKSEWLPRLNSRPNFLARQSLFGRPAGLGWRRLLRLE